MALYIKGMGAISPQKTWGDDTLLSEAIGYGSNRLSCVEPNYAEWVDAKSIRRMSRILKMGVTSGLMALRDAQIEKPDGIITGTGLGCLEDTGIFLTKMIELREQALNPTPFIQSTHNTIGSLIALLLQCQGYNQTFTDQAFSFENSLMDASLQLNEQPNQHFLVGGVDEITDISHTIQNRFNVYRKTVKNSLDLFSSAEKGTIHGEGSAFFVVSGNKGKHDKASVESIATFYKPDHHQLKAGIQNFLDSAGISAKEIDLVLIGKSGDALQDELTDSIIATFFSACSIGFFKHLCGEYPVASSFGLWLAARILHDRHIPEVVVYKDGGRPVQNILLYNPYFGTHHSLILLKSCRDTL